MADMRQITIYDLPDDILADMPASNCWITEIDSDGIEGHYGLYDIGAFTTALELIGRIATAPAYAYEQNILIKYDHAGKRGTLAQVCIPPKHTQLELR